MKKYEIDLLEVKEWSDIFIQIAIKLVCLFCVVLISSCTNKEHRSTASITIAFFETYNERTDFEKFLSFYNEDIVLEDIINGDRVVGKAALRNFFDWKNPDFKSLDSNRLVIHERIISDQQAVVKGHFSRFSWGGTEFEAMHFTTILTFDTAGKIIKQVDWINYPATLVNYSERANANEWLE